VLVGDTLLVANAQEETVVNPAGSLTPPPMPGILGFDMANGLSDREFPALILDWTHSNLIGCRDLDYAGGALFAASYWDSGVYPTTGQVHVFRRARSMPTHQRPDFALNDPEDILTPTAISATER